MPSRETVWFVPLLVVSLLVAMALTIFLSPAIGVPLLLLAAIIGGISWFRTNRSRTAEVSDFRAQADSDVDFSERDRETLTPAESDRTR
jgi:hypothetical protein